QIHYLLGLEDLEAGRMDQAIESLQEAIRLNPMFSDAEFQLAAALASKGKAKEAIQHYSRVLELNSDSIPALNNLAWILATQPDASLRNGTEAVRLAERACELTAYKEAILI